MNIRSLSSIVNTEALAYAIATIEGRAIPSMIDGMKPVQRFFMQSALNYAKSNKTKFVKVAAVGGGVSELGYDHGEGSAEAAGSKMARAWDNNLPLLEGDGNFGSRLVKEEAAARYIFCRVHQNFWNTYKDFDLMPANDDPECPVPKFFLPVFPVVLVNGVKGVATGFATDILPHSVKSVIKATKQAVQGKTITPPVVEFPDYNGNIVDIDGKLHLEGTYELPSKTKMVITEVPVKYDRKKYVEVLDSLEESGKIVSYEDLCGACGFRFEVTLKREFASKLDHELVMKTFKLRQAISQNITVLNEHGKLREYDTPVELIKDFVEVRMQFVEKRIEHEQEQAKKRVNVAKARILFINSVLDGSLVINNRPKKDVLQDIESIPELKGFGNELVSMSIYRLTSEEVQRLHDELSKCNQEYEYWSTTTPQVEYLKDLQIKS